MTSMTTLYVCDGGKHLLWRAVDNCRRDSKTACKLYPVDDFIVWF